MHIFAAYVTRKKNSMKIITLRQTRIVDPEHQNMELQVLLYPKQETDSLRWRGLLFGLRQVSRDESVFDLTEGGEDCRVLQEVAHFIR